MIKNSNTITTKITLTKEQWSVLIMTLRSFTPTLPSTCWEVVEEIADDITTAVEDPITDKE